MIDAASHIKMASVHIYESTIQTKPIRIVSVGKLIIETHEHACSAGMACLNTANHLHGCEPVFIAFVSVYMCMCFVDLCAYNENQYLGSVLRTWYNA